MKPDAKISLGICRNAWPVYTSIQMISYQTSHGIGLLVDHIIFVRGEKEKEVVCDKGSS